MPAGVRYSGWTHVHVDGERSAGARYLPAARKFLGEALAGAAFAQLGVTKLQRTLDDGTVIVAEKTGDIPRVTIRPPTPDTEAPPTRTPDDIVVWARDENRPSGIDPENPQQILRPSGSRPYAAGTAEGIQAAQGDAGRREWQVFTYDDQTDGRRTGTFVGMFPDGIPHAGNVDWCGARGQRVSWYGPSTRYWYDPFVQMTAQYGKKVFALGQVLLDTEAYATQSAQGENPEPDFDEKWVMGAGISDGWLYVMQSRAHVYNAPPPDPTDVVEPDPGAITPYYLFCPAYTPAAIELVACRYLLAEVGDVPGYVVVPKTREVLWSANVARALNPWFFNPECNEAVTFLLPESQAYGSSVFAPTFDASASRMTLSITETGGNLVAAVDIAPESLAAGGGQAAVAADYLRDGTPVEISIRRRDVGASGSLGVLNQRFDLVVGGAAIELRSLRRQDVTENYFDTRRWVMWADARAGAAVLRRQEVHFRDPPGSGNAFVSMQVWLEVWLQGLRVADRTDGRTDVDAANNSFGTYVIYNSNPADHQSDNLGDVLSPMVALYGWCWGHLASTGSPHTIAPSHAGYCYLPRQPADVFGFVLTGYVTPAGVDHPSIRYVFVDRINATPEMARLDKDGMDIVLGAAATDGLVVASAYPKGAGAASPEHVVAPETNDQLPAITGVGGENSRFHPVWKLGKPLRSAA